MIVKNGMNLKLKLMIARRVNMNLKLKMMTKNESKISENGE